MRGSNGNLLLVLGSDNVRTLPAGVVFVAYYLRVTRLELVLFFFLVGITTRRRKNSTGDRD